MIQVTDNGTLEDHCASPAFECLEFSLTVADDGNWDNVTALLSLDNLSGTSMIGPSSVQIMSRDQGDPENRGVFSWIIKNFTNTTSGSIKVNVSDGFLDTAFTLDIAAGDFVVTQVCDENGNSFGDQGACPAFIGDYYISDWAGEETTGGVTSQIQGNISPATFGNDNLSRLRKIIRTDSEGKYIVNTQGHILVQTGSENISLNCWDLTHKYETLDYRIGNREKTSGTCYAENLELPGQSSFSENMMIKADGNLLQTITRSNSSTSRTERISWEKRSNFTPKEDRLFIQSDICYTKYGKDDPRRNLHLRIYPWKSFSRYIDSNRWKSMTVRIEIHGSCGG